MNNKILILFTHPAIHKSRVNKRIIEYVRNLEGITFVDLYEKYPDFLIDVSSEQITLKEHEIVVFHHPFYWYGCPAILKEWMDLVLEYGFAYGPGGNELKGKKMMSVITAGGSKDAYKKGGYNNHTVREFLLPFEQTANLCGMQYLPPLVIHDAINMNLNLDLHQYAELYKNILIMLRDDRVKMDNLTEFEFINDYYKNL
ncbi:MAG: NAD(P)H oxidoreductase [Candidatus Dadabacteria bacterium]|nr:NAD(P)H oxidoreductase [Candidatus Dadabacteria bacterium]